MLRFLKPVCLKITPSYRLNTVNRLYTCGSKAGNHEIVTHTQLPPQHSLTTASVIKADTGLNDFIRRTYWSAIVGIVPTLCLGQAMAPLTMEHPYISFGAGFLLSMGGIFGFGYSKYQIHKHTFKSSPISKVTDQKFDYLYSTNSVPRLLSYSATVAGLSLSMSPVIGLISYISPTLMPVSILLSSAIFGGSLAYAYRQPQGELLKWKAPLMGGLTGLVGLGLVGLGSQMLIGPNVLSSALASFDTYVGLGVFAGMVAYDTHQAIDIYEKGDPDHLGCGLSLYLDFMNIWVRIVEMLMPSPSKTDETVPVWFEKHDSTPAPTYSEPEIYTVAPPSSYSGSGSCDDGDEDD